MSEIIDITETTKTVETTETTETAETVETTKVAEEYENYKTGTIRRINEIRKQLDELRDFQGEFDMYLEDDNLHATYNYVAALLKNVIWHVEFQRPFPYHF